LLFAFVDGLALVCGLRSNSLFGRYFLRACNGLTGRGFSRLFLFDGLFPSGGLYGFRQLRDFSRSLLGHGLRNLSGRLTLFQLDRCSFCLHWSFNVLNFRFLLRLLRHLLGHTGKQLDPVTEVRAVIGLALVSTADARGDVVVDDDKAEVDLFLRSLFLLGQISDTVGAGALYRLPCTLDLAVLVQLRDDPGALTAVDLEVFPESLWRTPLGRDLIRASAFSSKLSSLKIRLLLHGV